jgi:FtsP/CotA-like multicopper oxidase with cupredoxin domain
MINDWTDTAFTDRYIDLLNGHESLSADTILINGMGSYTNGLKTPKATFTVKKGYRYRFRVIYSGSLICPIEFSISGHNMTVVSSDARDIVPIEVDAIQFVSGK